MTPSILDSYFTQETMSVHFKENTPWNAKLGRPGARNSHKATQIVTKTECEQLINTLFQEIETRDDSFLEIDKPLFKVIQMGTYRIVIVLPPLSDGIELTVVRPIKQMHIEEYDLPSALFELLKNKAQ
jgi:ATPase